MKKGKRIHPTPVSFLLSINSCDYITFNIACVQCKNYRYTLLVISIINSNIINTDIPQPVTTRAQTAFRELSLLAEQHQWQALLDTSFHTLLSPSDTDQWRDLLICGKQLSILSERKWFSEHVTYCHPPNICNARFHYPCIK